MSSSDFHLVTSGERMPMKDITAEEKSLLYLVSKQPRPAREPVTPADIGTTLCHEL